MRSHLLIAALILCGLTVLIYVMKRIRLRYFLLSALSGAAALIAADLICGLFDFSLPVNVFTLCVSACGGIPGVILLNILFVFFR